MATLRLGDVQAIVDRAGQVHRQLLLRAGGARPQLATRHQGRRDLGDGGRALPPAWSGPSPCSASFASHGIDSVEVGVAMSALAFVVVSRLTPPTPDREPRDILRRTLKLRMRAQWHGIGRLNLAQSGLAPWKRLTQCPSRSPSTRTRHSRRAAREADPARRAAGAARPVHHARARVGHGRRGDGRPLSSSTG